jgi:FkbM family methyltransferase
MDKTSNRIINDNKLTVIYDIGAYQGDFAKKAKKAFPDNHLYMFEANPSRKSPIEVTDKIKWFNGVLSDKEDVEVKFYYRDNTGDSYYRENTNNYQDDDYKLLKTKTLEKVISDNNLELPEFIKIDTQGSELDILSKVDLSNCIAIHCEVPAEGQIYNHGAPDHEQYIAFFRSKGFIYNKVVKDYVKREVIVQHDIIFSKVDFKND